MKNKRTNLKIRHLGIPKTVFRTTGITIRGSIVAKLNSAIHAVFIPRRMVTAIHAFPATHFITLGMRDKAVASILATTAMPANDIFLFTNATGFRHMVFPSLVSVQHENSIQEAVPRVNAYFS